MKDQQQFIQILATLILFFGCGCVAAADKYVWRDLSNAGATVIGIGGGILTGQKLSSHNESQQLNINTPVGGPDPKA